MPHAFRRRYKFSLRWWDIGIGSHCCQAVESSLLRCCSRNLLIIRHPFRSNSCVTFFCVVFTRFRCASERFGVRRQLVSLERLAHQKSLGLLYHSTSPFDHPSISSPPRHSLRWCLYEHILRGSRILLARIDTILRDHDLVLLPSNNPAVQKGEGKGFPSTDHPPTVPTPPNSLP